MQPIDPLYQAYLSILHEELVPATGCTEPIALAYCAAKARETLGMLPERVLVEVSGNIIKNVKSVVVPNTNGLKGIQAAVAAGIVAGDASLALEVINHVDAEKREKIQAYSHQCPIEVKLLDTNELLDMLVTVYAGGEYASVRISRCHSSITEIQKNGRVIFCKSSAETHMQASDQNDLLTIERICDFAKSVALKDIATLLQRQIDYNTAIAEQGMEGHWGAEIGKTLTRVYGNDIRTRAKAMAAAGSDARMSGCELPVIIASGSGNQGMAVSLPVIAYAKEYGKTQEELYRALVVANLSAIHQKYAIGKLSAFCGAVTAGSGAGAGIAWLLTGDVMTVAHTIVNALAIVSGMLCDGAKPSCAAKIASAVDAGILGYEMYRNGQQFLGGDGIVSKGVENTIHNIGVLGHDGMKETDQTILTIMTES